MKLNLPPGVTTTPMLQSDPRYARRNPYSYVVMKNGRDVGYVTKYYSYGKTTWYFDNAEGAHGEVGTMSAAVAAVASLTSNPIPASVLWIGAGAFALLGVAMIIQSMRASATSEAGYTSPQSLQT
jgi:hypothetical protein